MRPISVAIDMVGGDRGLPVILAGVLDACSVLGKRFVPVLCGNKKSIERELSVAATKVTTSLWHIEHCADALGKDFNPSRVWKEKAHSSIIRSIALQKEGVVDASISAGDTGVLLAASFFLLGTHQGITRPALAAFLPTIKKRPSLLLDVGANLDCRSELLVTFARMGAAYYKQWYPRTSPVVKLLNIGTEEHKGTAAITEAHGVLKASLKGYSGFIEASRACAGDADVIICDGFAGNVLLKSYESLNVLFEKAFLDAPTIKMEIRSRMAMLNAEIYGAAPLLGVNGVVLKAHGNSTAKAIANAVITTVQLAQTGLTIAGNKPHKRDAP